MAENLKSDPPSKKKMSILPIIILAIVGLGLMVFCIFGILLSVNSTQFNLADSSSPSPTIPFTQTVAPPPTPNIDIQLIATQSASQWSILFSDTFDGQQKEKSRWNIENKTDEFSDYTLELKEGKYVWSVKSKEQVFLSNSPRIKSVVTDFHLSAELKLTSGTYKPRYGLTFRENSIGDLYFFGIYGEGFMVDIYHNQAWSTIIDYTKSSAIFPQEANLLTVIAEGSHFTYFINNQFVGEMTDERINEGFVGFGLAFSLGDLQNTFEFDNFILRIPE